MTQPRQETKKIAHVPLPARAAKIFEVELTVVAFISKLQTQCSYMVDMSRVWSVYVSTLLVRAISVQTVQG